MGFDQTGGSDTDSAGISDVKTVTGKLSQKGGAPDVGSNRKAGALCPCLAVRVSNDQRLPTLFLLPGLTVMLVVDAAVSTETSFITTAAVQLTSPSISAVQVVEVLNRLFGARSVKDSRRTTAPSAEMTTSPLTAASDALSLTTVMLTLLLWPTNRLVGVEKSAMEIS